MKLSLVSASFLLFFFSQISAGWAFPLRTSTLNDDVVIRQTLFNALQWSGSLSITAGNDSLVCDALTCKLVWDSASPGYNQSADTFRASLYDVLNGWADHVGNTDASIQKITFASTNSVEINLTSGTGRQDFIKCSALVLSLNSFTQKTCSIVVSDYQTGTTEDLQTLWNHLLSAKTYLNAEIQSLLALTAGADFANASSTANANRVIQSTRTLDTDLIVDELNVSMNYAYVNPILTNGGLPIVDGISISLSGTEDASQNFLTESVQSQTYALSVIIP